MNHSLKLAPTMLCLGLVLQAGAVRAGQDAGADGAKIVDESCASCHTSGLMGAPKIGDAADWQARLKIAGSVSGLLTTTQRGKGSMPPRGGESSLSDTELQSAIQYMLSKSGVTY